jgi:DNA-directed RNA polymerase specialized sigma24 family protein
MKNFKDSDYALNKYSKGVVYRFADEIVEVTLDDYLSDNPGKTAADFAVLKAESDAMFRRQDRFDNASTKKNVAISATAESELGYALSPDEIVVEIPERERLRQERLAIAAQALDKLTDVQRRRYIKHHVDGLSTWDIAEQEGSNQKSVYESLKAAEKKIEKFLQNTPSKRS